MKQRFIGITASLIALLLVPGTTHGDTDWKTYPGTLCQVHRNPSIAEYDAFGGVCNISTTKDLAILCPLVRDMSQSRFPILIRHSGRSGNTGKAMLCTLRNMKRTAANSGEAVAGFSKDLQPITSAKSEGIQTKETDFKNSGIGSHDFGSHVLTCLLPKSNFSKSKQQITSCLYSYSIQEWDGK
jgi:hypothetical protein